MQLLLSAHLSHCNSVRLSVHSSVTQVDQSKTVQARITKSTPSVARKTLVSEIVKLFHKFEGGHPKWGCYMRGGWEKLAIFSQWVTVSQKRCEIGPRLLLITNRNSYTGSRLAPNSMILDDLECQNRGFYGFFGDFGLQQKSISFTMWCHATVVIWSR